MACVVYCPKKAIQYHVPADQLKRVDNASMRMIGRLMKLPEGRLRYHNPAISAKDLMLDRKYYA
jgi:hypothetical protein